MKIVTQDFTAEMLHSSDAPLFVQHLLCKLNGTPQERMITSLSITMLLCALVYTCAYIYSRNVNYLAPVAIMSRIIYLAMQDSHKNFSKCDTWQLISQQLYITLFAAWQIAIIKIQAIKTQRVQIRKA